MNAQHGVEAMRFSVGYGGAAGFLFAEVLIQIESLSIEELASPRDRVIKGLS